MPKLVAFRATGKLSGFQLVGRFVKANGGWLKCDNLSQPPISSLSPKFFKRCLITQVSLETCHVEMLNQVKKIWVAWHSHASPRTLDKYYVFFYFFLMLCLRVLPALADVIETLECKIHHLTLKV